jgi:hypothetical protein
MPTSTLTPGDEKQDEKLNRSQQAADQLVDPEQRGTINMADFDRNYQENADATQEDANIEKARQAEAGSAPNTSWANKTEPKTTKEKIKFFSIKGLKKNSPILGFGGIIGIIIFLLGGWLPTMLIPSLEQGAVAENDVRGTLLERRLIAKLKLKMTDSGPCDTKLSLCRDKKMPKIMLQSMAKDGKGIVAVNANGDPVDIKGTGYMTENPTHYKFTNGSTEKIIPASEFVNEYKSNPAFRKLFKTAYNMRYLSYSGGFIKKIMSKWGMKKNGGKAGDTSFNESNASDKVAEATKNGAADTSESGAKKTFKDRVRLLLKRSADKVKKTNGDPIIAIGSGVCMAIGLPTFVAGTVRAIQLAQVVGLASDFILSAGAMIRSGDAEPEQISALGKTLTDEYKVEGSDNAQSALDSPILLAAVGAATGSTLAASKYIPGYSLYSNPGIQAASTINAASKEACNLINSPQAAIASAGITAAIGAASAGVGAAALKVLQAVGKVALVFGAIDGMMALLEQTGVIDIIGDGAYNVAVDLLGNIYGDAQGVELGDALGVGIFAAFSLTALGGGAAVLTKSQAKSFKVAMDEVNNEYRDEDIATLSPFDTSSQYTFLGSIVSKLALSTAGSGNMVSSAISTVGSILKSPFSLVSSASAEVDPIEAKYGYASLLGIDEDIAVTIAGTPATGIPTEYLDMGADTAYNLVSNEVDPNTGEPYEPNAILDNLGLGKDSSLSTTIAECADADLETISGCVIASSTTTVADSVSSCASEDANCDPEKEESDSTKGTVTVEGDRTTQESAAQRIYYMDHQIENMLSGNDEEDADDNAGGIISATGRPEGAVDLGKGWGLAAGVDYSSVQCDPRTDDQGVHTTVYGATIRTCRVKTTYSTDKSTNGAFAVNAAISTNIVNMFEAANAAGITIGLTDGMRYTFSGGYTSQHPSGLAMDISISKGGNPICFNPEDNVGGWGDKDTAFRVCQQIGGAQFAAFQWLNENAEKYGFYNYDPEPWHWSTSGK